MQWVLLVAWITPSAAAAVVAAQLRNLPGVVHKINTQSGSLAWVGAPINPLTRHQNLHTCGSIYLMGVLCVVCALWWCLYWGPYAHVNLASKHVPCRQNKHKYTNTLRQEAAKTRPCLATKVRVAMRIRRVCVPHSMCYYWHNRTQLQCVPIASNLTAWQLDILTDSLLC